MSYAQYLRQLLRPLGVYDVESRYLGGELESEGLALDGVEGVLDELQREANLATAQDWGLERIASLLRRRPPATTTKAMREALAALLRISGDSFTLEAINDTIAGCGVIARVEETKEPGTVEVWFPDIPGIPPPLMRSTRSSPTSFQPTCSSDTASGLSPGSSWSATYPPGWILRKKPPPGKNCRPMWSREHKNNV